MKKTLVRFLRQVCLIAGLLTGSFSLNQTMPGVKAAPTITFVVNSTADGVDFNPGDGVCETASGNGTCTLRAAVMEANAYATVNDTITLPAGTYTLSLVGSDDTAAAGDLDVLQNLTINGVSSSMTVINANGNLTNDRAFDIFSPAQLWLNGVTVQNGKSPQGGAIRNQNKLTITNSAFTANEAISSIAEDVHGGAIYTDGSLEVSNSTFSLNKATSVDKYAWGGAVYIYQTFGSFTGVSFNQNQAKGSASDYGLGGALVNYASTVTLDNATFTQNQALSFDVNCVICGEGGAIYMTGAPPHPTTTIIGSNFQGNTAQGSGGGIMAQGGRLDIYSTTIQGGSAREGGGVYVAVSNEAYLENTSVTGNTAQLSGGGISSKGKLTLNNSTLSTNQALNSGGGLTNSGSLVIAGSTISQNIVNDPNITFESGGGIHNYGSQPASIFLSLIEDNQATTGAGIYTSSTYTMTIAQSTVTDNQASGSGGGVTISNGALVVHQSALFANTSGSNGGGFYITHYSNVHIINSTISGNQTSGYGGGIYSWSSKLYLSNATITLNKADQDGFVNPGGDGGGISNTPVVTGTISIKNSVIAGNDDGTPAANQAEDCWGPLVSAGYNLLGNNTLCTGLTHGVNGDQVGTGAAPLNPMLNTLALNGGPTRSHLPMAGSPLIDAGNPAGCFDFQGLWLIFDQRGYLRPVDGNANAVAVCDIGATEYLAVLAKLLYLPFMLQP